MNDEIVRLPKTNFKTFCDSRLDLLSVCGHPVESIVEVGVNHGEYLKVLAAAAPQARIFGVDVKITPQAREAVPRATLIEDTSHNAAQQLWPNTFDFVYIDADHSYKAVTQDLIAWWPRVAIGGVFAGHDYVRDGWHSGLRPDDVVQERDDAHPHEFGVIRAVDEFASVYNLELHLTSPHHDGGWRSWWFHKVKP
jgi:cephalosporin hydroxylase